MNWSDYSIQKFHNDEDHYVLSKDSAHNIHNTEVLQEHSVLMLKADTLSSLGILIKFVKLNCQVFYLS